MNRRSIQISAAKIKRFHSNSYRNVGWTTSTNWPVDAPFTIAFECSGNAAAAESALDQLDYAGTLVFVGTGNTPPRVNQNRVIVMEQTLIGAYNYDAAGFRPALELLASGSLPLDRLIEPVDIYLDEVLPTMHRLTAGELPGKVMVMPEVST